jgi:hypothetical protein
MAHCRKIQQVHVHACLNPHKYRAEPSLERLPQELTPFPDIVVANPLPPRSGHDSARVR